MSRVDLLVKRVEVRLPVLLEVADVLPVALADMAVEGRPSSRSRGKSSFEKSNGVSSGTWRSTDGSST